jgi:hypothetical protein
MYRTGACCELGKCPERAGLGQLIQHQPPPGRSQRHLQRDLRLPAQGFGQDDTAQLRGGQLGQATQEFANGRSDSGKKISIGHDGNPK